MLFQINNSVIHLKDAIIKDDPDDKDEYNQAFKSRVDSIYEVSVTNSKNKKKKKPPSSQEKKNLKDSSDQNINNIISTNSTDLFIFEKSPNPQDSKDEYNKKTFYELNSNLYKNKSTLNSLCNTKEHSSRLIKTLSTTQKILMIAAFIASELDPSKDSLFLRGIKRTMTNWRKVILIKTQ